MKTKVLEVQKIMRMMTNPKKALLVAKFFKTQKGEYGEGDVFLGISVPETRRVAKKYAHLNFTDLKILLHSKYHEERLLALIILVNRYTQSKSEQTHREIVQFYLKNKARINNWDLVDVSSYKILGHFCYHYSQQDLLKKLVHSSHHWDRRIAVVSTLAFIKNSKTQIIYNFAPQIFQDDQDLMHKATGWMLREAGKINPNKLRFFLSKYRHQMPRVMLRYSIEKFSLEERRKILKKPKSWA